MIALLRILIVGVLSLSLLSITACIGLPGKTQPDPPDWVSSKSLGEGYAVTSASFEIFSREQAKAHALDRALAQLARSKKGFKVNVRSQGSENLRVKMVGGSERVEAVNTVNTEFSVDNEQIDVQGVIEETWEDFAKRRLWVLVRALP